MQDFRLKIDGMSCAHCVKAVTSALEKVSGVKVREVAIGIAAGEFDPASSSPTALAAAVTRAGYTALPEAEGK